MWLTSVSALQLAQSLVILESLHDRVSIKDVVKGNKKRARLGAVRFMTVSKAVGLMAIKRTAS